MVWSIVKGLGSCRQMLGIICSMNSVKRGKKCDEQKKKVRLIAGTAGNLLFLRWILFIMPLCYMLSRCFSPLLIFKQVKDQKFVVSGQP